MKLVVSLSRVRMTHLLCRRLLQQNGFGACLRRDQFEEPAVVARLTHVRQTMGDRVKRRRMSAVAWQEFTASGKRERTNLPVKRARAASASRLKATAHASPQGWLELPLGTEKNEQ
jgi:hypothetical protein